MRLRLYPLRFRFRAIDAVHFPRNAANSVRGALGLALVRRGQEALFTPRPAAGPSGLRDAPRPFVLRVAHLDGRDLQPGETFEIGLPLFDLRKEAGETMRLAFAEMGALGFGPRRGRSELIAIEGAAPLALPLDAAAEPVSRVIVRFVTPTELKIAGGLAERPEFAILAARLRDRISALSMLYGEGPLNLDFRGFAERAAQIRMTRCDVGHEDIRRRSSRTGQTHPLGGLTGEAIYEGDLREFLPWLEAARYTGAGRQTVWGKGELAVSVEQPG
jgi:hypothetical protein